jgi:SAM-dependent methyltransferase
VPAAFWLAAEVHFDDDFRLRPVHVIMGTAYIATGYLSWLAAVERRLPGVLFAPQYGHFWLLLPKILGLAIVLHALLRVYVGAGTDLVLPRRRARFGVLGMSGTYVLIVLVGEALFSGSESEALAESAHSLAVLVLVVAVALLCLRFAPEMLRAPRLTADAPAVDPALSERLQRLIEVDEVFREEGLTIGRLAERLGAPEHKVRQLINSQLGFKNFNALLNRYRIAAAEKVLADQARHGATIARVAAAVSRGFVAGVDPSADMCRMAGRRNRQAVASGRVALRQASAEALPYPDRAFDKVLTVHTLYFWPDLVPPFREIARVLKAGGRLVLAHRSDKSAQREFPAPVYRFRYDDEVTDALREAGLTSADVVHRTVGRARISFRVARR